MRQMVVFVAVVAFAIDLFLLVMEVSDVGLSARNGDRVLGNGVLLGTWDVIKATVAAWLLLVMAVRLRSWALMVLGLIFVSVAVLDDATLHSPIGRFLGDRLALDNLGSLLPASAADWGQLVVLTTAALLGLVAIWSAPVGRFSYLRVSRTNLTVLLGLLFFFAGFVDILAASYGATPFETIEETGEHIVLSITLAYVIGLYVDARLLGISPARQSR